MKATVFTTGRLGQDAVSKTLTNTGVIEFSFATSNRYTNKDGEKVEDTDWHNAKIYVKEINDSFVGLLKKGATVTLQGSLEYDEYEKGEVKIKAAYINVRPGNIQIVPVGNKDTAELPAEETEEPKN